MSSLGLGIKMAKTEEPSIRGVGPEKKLQDAIKAEIEELLEQKQLLLDFFILPNFGLDLAVFMKWTNRSTARFLELKAFIGSRQGGVGFGNQRGNGTQVDFLLLPQSQIALSDQFCRWILVDGTRPRGSARFAIFGNNQARKAAMGGVRRGKQNNLRVKTLMSNAITWDELSQALESFLTK